jgi:type II secretion system protein G
MKKGFTLLELLVVIAIIGVLASIVMASLNSARSKARDAKRFQDLKQLQIAVESYYSQNGVYPGSSIGTARTGAESNGCGPVGYWCILESELAPFMSKLPRDPLGNQNQYIFNYKYNLNNNPNSYYGIGFFPENPNSFQLDRAGFVSVGNLPSYCANKYSGSNGVWNNWDGANLCNGGN